MTDPYGPPTDPQPTQPQPAYGAPIPPQPSYGAPTQAQPAYGATAEPPPAVIYQVDPGWTPPPGYAASPWGPPAPPPPHRGRFLVWLIPALVAAVLVGAGITYAVTSGGGRAKVAAGPAASPSPSNTASTVFTLPDSVDGLPPSGNASAADLVSRMMAAAMPSAKTVSGVFQDPTQPKRIILLSGVEAPIVDPATEVKNGFTGMSITLPGLSAPKDYPPGPQGGAMQCASGKIKIPNAGTLPIAVCVVADHKGLILLVCYSSTLAHTVDVITTLRPKFETG